MKLVTRKKENWVFSVSPGYKDLVFGLLVSSPGYLMLYRVLASDVYFYSVEEWIWTILTLFVFCFLGASVYPDGSQVIITKETITIRFVRSNKLDQWDGKIKKEFVGKLKEISSITVVNEYEMIDKVVDNVITGEFERKYREKKKMTLEKQQKNRWTLVAVFDTYKIPLMEGYLVGPGYHKELQGIQQEMMSIIQQLRGENK